MLVRYRRGGAEHVLDVHAQPEATVADLAAALAEAAGLDAAAAGGLLVDGRAVGPTTPVAALGLAPGADLASIGGRPAVTGAHRAGADRPPLTRPPAAPTTPGPGGGGPTPTPAAAHRPPLPHPPAHLPTPGPGGGGPSRTPAAAHRPTSLHDPPAHLPTPGPGGGGPQLPPAAAHLRVVGGLAAGLRLPLPAGPTLVGRRAQAAAVLDDPTVSAAHLTVTVEPDGTATVADTGSTNGTKVDGEWVVDGAAPVDPGAVVAAGTVRLAVVPAAAEPRPARLGPAGADGRRPIHRPPRPAPPPAPAPVDLPGPPPPPIATTRLAVTALVAPLAVGVVAAVVLGHPALALLALLGPVTVGGTWLEDRRRARADGRRRRATAADDAATVTAAVTAASAAEARRRRAAHPDPGELAARAAAAGGRLWERRSSSPGLLAVTVGHADLAWSPPVRGASPAPDVAAAVDAAARLADVPVPVDLAATTVGVTGPRAAALAVTRSVVCQLVTLAGPADVRLAVLGPPADWSWTAWLPHLAPPSRATVVVADGEAAIDEARPLLAAGTPAVVVAPSADRLPSACAAVVEVAADGRARLHPGTDGGPVDLVATGVPLAVASQVARHLARLADPEDRVDGALPASVALLDAIGLPDPTPEAVVARWRAAPAGLPAVLGAGPDGAFAVDLCADGPHALVAGTTGAGKSELLRSLVASLAATLAPDDLNVVLLDYKGGSAFDRCADLPHVVGVVTDLDEHLGRRALVALEGELRERERRLRAAGAADLAAYRAPGATEPLPRLLVVVDEFAALAAELPGFVDRLVGLAQRGRSLGIHLVLATQRPSGVVSESIRANTNLRIALRVQDGGESTDVVGAPDAALLPRDRPGRAVARLGPGELVPFQAALATRPAPAARPPVVAVPAGTAPPRPPDGGPTDLDRLVTAVAGAARLAGTGPQRRPWPEPLPTRLALDDLPPGALALADEPEHQRRSPWQWDPAGGHLLVLGVPGSGVTTALAAAVLALAGEHPPDRLHVHVLDCGSGGLAQLAALPHAGAVVGPADDERRERLLRMVRDEVDRRRAVGGEGRPCLVLVVDGYGALRAACDGVAGLALLDGMARVLADGPAVGVTAVIGAESPSAVPTSVAALAPDRLVLRQADPLSWAAAGVAPRDVPDLGPGRGLHLPSGRLVQVGLPGAGAVARVAARWPAPDATAAPFRVGTLPDDVPAASLPPAEVGDGRWRLPVGTGDRELGPAWLPVDDGDPVLVAGPPRSGRSTALATLAAVATAAGLPVTVLGPRRPAALPLAGPHLVLVDDADAVDDPGGHLAAIAAGRRPGVRLVAAARTDAVRRASGSWLAAFRRCRTGIALRPDLDADADLWAAPLPRRRRVRPVVGRGLLVADGGAEVVQVARP